MESLEERVNILVEQVKEQTSPGSRGVPISVFVATALREKEINLYEAYLVNGMKMEFTRLSYVQPAWSNRVRISILLELLNLRLLAAAFGETGEEQRWTGYAKEAFSMNQEKRPHYILDHYPEYLKETIPPEFLETLKAVRARRSKPFNKGPYHTEVFPYDQCSCEELLLRGETFPPDRKELCGSIEHLLIELALLLEE